VYLDYNVFHIAKKNSIKLIHNLTKGLFFQDILLLDRFDNIITSLPIELTACELQKAQSPALLGSYTPQCEKDGSYTPMQCHGSTGYCWCVDENGEEKDNTRKRGAVNCTEITTKKGIRVWLSLRSLWFLRVG
jgi:hypothetical protein